MKNLQEQLITKRIIISIVITIILTAIYLYNVPSAFVELQSLYYIYNIDTMIDADIYIFSLSFLSIGTLIAYIIVSIVLKSAIIKGDKKLDGLMFATLTLSYLCASYVGLAINLLVLGIIKLEQMSTDGTNFKKVKPTLESDITYNITTRFKLIYVLAIYLIIFYLFFNFDLRYSSAFFLLIFTVIAFAIFFYVTKQLANRLINQQTQIFVYAFISVLLSYFATQNNYLPIAIVVIILYALKDIYSLPYVNHNKPRNIIIEMVDARDNNDSDNELQEEVIEGDLEVPSFD